MIQLLLSISSRVYAIFSDMRPVTPPEDKDRKDRKTVKHADRKLIVTGDADMLLKHLFAHVQEEKKNSTSAANAAHLKRGR